ncbi:MAG: zinc-dependent alcohol dehydrogenase [Terriglobales bacterium]
MKALLLTEYSKLTVTDVPRPTVEPHQVLVEVRACGICGSDIHGYDGSTGRRVPPLIMGHEAAGVIAEMGREVRGLQLGDRVTFDSTVSCGICYYCRRGRINLCDNRQVLGVSCGEYRRHGAFAEYVVVPQQIVYKLPDSLPFEQAALVEAVSIAVHAVHRTPLELGDSAVVVGSGMIGLLVIQALRQAGCSSIFAVDLDDTKLARAQTLGAVAGFNPSREDVTVAVAARTEGRGAAVAIECVGATAPIQTAIAATRKGGTVTLVGNLAPKVELPLQAIVTRELNLLGSCGSSNEIPACMELMASGAIRADALITARAPLEEGPSWFARLHKGEPGLMKVVLTPTS